MEHSVKHVFLFLLEYTILRIVESVGEATCKFIKNLTCALPDLVMSDADIADKGAVTGGGVMEPAGQVGLVVVHAATHWVIFTLLEAEAQGVLALQRCSSHMEPAITYDEKG